MFSSIVLVATTGYATAGAIFATLFIWRALPALDPAAGCGTWGFRLLIAPGVAALWPVLLWKWLGARRGRA